MIDEINIKNLGIIPQASLSFSRGLTALTGETGAGKTMILSALGLLLGHRSDSSIIKHDANQTIIEGRWILPTENKIVNHIKELGGEPDSLTDSLTEVLINRVVSREGKNRINICGIGTPLSTLTSISENLVVVHGQSDQIRLKSNSAQREALDKYAGAVLLEALSDYQAVHVQWKDKKNLLEDLIKNRASKTLELEFLQTAIKQISEINPYKGEDEELSAKANKLTYLEDLKASAEAALAAYSTEDYNTSDMNQLANLARKALESSAEYDDVLKVLSVQAETIYELIKDLTVELSSYVESIDMDSLNELNHIQERRAELNSLIRKYGPTLDDVLSTYEEASNKVANTDVSEEGLAALEKEINVLFTTMMAKAKVLTQIRTEYSSQLESAVSSELRGLAMANSGFIVQVRESEEYNNYGKDEVQLLLKNHGNAEAKPLNKGASGGELSRIMLALEVVLASEEKTTFIFDEVDSGVGGASAIEIGKRLSKLAETAQVIVVTHLPQVAAYADKQLKVVKDIINDETATNVVDLTEDERIVEIARMLSGSESEISFQHAKELLASAKQK